MSRKLPISPAVLASGDGNQWQTLRSLLPYLWPEGRMDLKIRVVLAMFALVTSKIITVLTPYSFKYATDALTASGSAAAIAFSVPFFFVLAYGVGRISMRLFTAPSLPISSARKAWGPTVSGERPAKDQVPAPPISARP